METRVALIGIIVEKESSVAQLNELLHQYGRTSSAAWACPTGKRA